MSRLYRDYGPALLMLGASLALVLVLLGEWLYFRGERADLKAQLMVKEQVNPGGSESEIADFTLPDLHQYTEMTERPLFMEGRRPAPEDEQAAAEEMTDDSKPLNLKLMGVVFTPKETSALFVDEKGKYRHVRKNAVVGGWKLAEVREDRVIMEQNGDQKELPLLKPKPKAAMPAPKTGKAEVRGPGQPGEANDEETDSSEGAENADSSEDADEADVSDESEETTDDAVDDSSESDEDSDVQEE